MKRLAVAFAISLSLFLAASFFIRPVIKFIAKKQLERVFPGSRVALGKIFFSPLKQLAFFDIEIKSKNVYDLKIKEVKLSYNLFARDYSLEGKIDFLEGLGLRLENAAMKLNKGSAPGDLSIEKIQYDKVTIADIHSRLKFERNTLILEALIAKVFAGKAEGYIVLSLSETPAYTADLYFTNLNLERFISDFDLKERFLMTGGLSGGVSLKGKGGDLTSLDGSLSASSQGGTLTITDKGFLENMARDQGQSLDLLVESFKNYHYNIGNIKLGMDQGDLILDVGLEGEVGKRDLQIIMHDVNLKGRF